ncbi:MAG: acetyl-CoA carboxylase biotin carboxylase subunit, partial [Gemmatimonadetes bacterium]|nr:acetyl-CoA carboxylase biotin carboxylase subunit [Gemmatimonadota bacterium]
GMRRVLEPSELEGAFNAASSEAQAAFSNGEMYVERLALKPRHVEIQVMGDSHGNVVHLYERECSVQRRHQKLVEESASPALDEKTRAEICEAGVRAASVLDYQGAGTVEFLFDQEGRFYFMEMNARIQVEHPVTELVTGRDLVKEQILVASGEKLSFRQEDVKFEGHAIECRVNAEDPARNFAPCPGTVTNLHLPGGPGVRVDTHLFAGASIPPYYDSLVAKLLTHGRDRTEAIQRMRRALSEFSLEGVQTTVPLLSEIMVDPVFLSGKYDTSFLERRESLATA